MKITVAAANAGKLPLLLLAGAAFFVMVLLAPLMTFNEVVSGQTSFTGEGNVLRQYIYVAILALAIYAAIKEGKGAKALILPIPIFAALAWCWLSLAWAVDPSISLRRLVVTTIAVWTAFIIVQGAGYERSVAILRAVLVAALVGNYLVVVLDPPLGIHMIQDASASTALIGNWRGFMMHKNVAGAICAVTMLLFVFDARKVNPVLRILVIAGAAYFLFKAQSKTSGGMLAIACLAGWVFQAYDNRIRTFAVPIIMFLTAAGWFLYSTYKDFAVETYLAPTSFTGRGLIWNTLLRYAGDNLLFGAGFGSFWNIGSGSPIYQYGQGFVRDVTVAHNGYLDLLVTIGLPGLLLAVFAAIVWPVWRLLVSRISPTRGGLTIALLLFCMGHNITESSLLDRDSLIGVLMMIAVAMSRSWEKNVSPAAQQSGRDVFAALKQRVQQPAPEKKST